MRVRGFWVRQVPVPVTAFITDPRIVICYNLTFYFTLMVSICLFIFLLKGWLSFLRVEAVGNMWLDNAPADMTSTPLATPIYCDNKDWDFYYDKYWTYKNISCKEVGSNEVFTKTLSVGVFWLTTLYQHTYFALQPVSTGSRNVQAQQVGGVENLYVSDLDNMILTAELSVKVPDLNYNSFETTMPMYFIYPNGTHSEMIYPAQGTFGVHLSKSVGEWLSMFGVRLDTKSPIPLAIESKGKPRYRTTGIRLNFDVEISNLKTASSEAVNSFPNFNLPGKIYAIIHLSVSDSWQRVTFGSEPLSGDSTAKAQRKDTDAYGIRCVWSTRDSRVGVASLVNTVASLFDVLIFFTIMRALNRYFTFRCLKHDSKKWRNSLRRHVDEHYVIHDTAMSLLENREADKAAVETAISRLIACMQQKNLTAKQVFNFADEDENNDINRNELKHILESDELGMTTVLSGHEFSSLFAVMDMDGDGHVSFAEFEKVLRLTRDNKEDDDAPNNGSTVENPALDVILRQRKNKSNNVVLTKEVELKEGVKKDSSGSSSTDGSSSLSLVISL